MKFFSKGSKKVNVDVENVEKLSVGWRPGSRLFHSVIVDKVDSRRYILN